MGKRMNSLDLESSGSVQPRNACMLICQVGCTNSAKALCRCSGSKAKSSSYNSKWNSHHMMNISPGGA